MLSIWYLQFIGKCLLSNKLSEIIKDVTSHMNNSTVIKQQIGPITVRTKLFNMEQPKHTFAAKSSTFC